MFIRHLIFIWLGLAGVCHASFSGVFKENTGLDEFHVDFFVKKNEADAESFKRKGILTLPQGMPRGIVVICHGFMCNKDKVKFLRAMFTRANFATFIFDFRAHGEIVEGQCCSFGRDEALDVAGAVRFLKEDPRLSTRLKNVPFFVYGFSMGAVASILAQAQDQQLFRAAIWDCPFESSDNVIGRGIAEMKISVFGYEFDMPGKELFRKYAYHPWVQSFLKATLKVVADMDASQVATCIVPVNTVEAVRKVTIPTFFIVCANDRKAPLTAVRELYDNVSGPARLWVTRGYKHFDSYFEHPEAYPARLIQFLNDVLENKVMPGKKEIIDPDIKSDGKAGASACPDIGI